MKKIEIIREPHIKIILEETVEEFKKRGIAITTDQAHCLNNLEYWSDSGSIENSVDNMIKRHVEIVEEKK
jgi:hypothetical protein